jgi:quinol monooxygenase YgiN
MLIEQAQLTFRPSEATEENQLLACQLSTTQKENHMYARRVSMNLKPNSVAEFTRTVDKDVIPTLRRQKGFQDEIAFVVPDGTKVLSISLWDSAESAEKYNTGAYTEVVKMLANVVDGTPRVDTYQVANSTFHKIPTPASV